MTAGNDVSRSTRFQPAEEARHAFAKGSESVAAFLHHHNGYLELPNHRSHPDEEVGWQFEAADRIGFVGVGPEGDDQKRRPELADRLQGALQGRAVLAFAGS